MEPPGLLPLSKCEHRKKDLGKQIAILTAFLFLDLTLNSEPVKKWLSTISRTYLVFNNIYSEDYFLGQYFIIITLCHYNQDVSGNKTLCCIKEKHCVA